MNYLLTGASGFIGSKIVELLLSQGHSVNYLGRKRSQQLDSRAAFHHWNTSEPPPLDSIPRLDAVVHLAGEPVAQHWSPEVKRRIYNSRIMGTRSLVSAIGRLEYKPSVLVSASATGYYGSRGDELLTEQSSPGSDFLAEVCRDWEREASRAREFNVRVVPIRVGIVLGRNGGALKQMLPIFRLGLGGKLGSGKQWMPWIHLHDLARLFVFAAEHAEIESPLNGVRQSVTNQVFTRELGRALNRPSLFTVPRFALKAAFGEMSDALLSSARVLPEETTKAGFEFQFPELGPALKEAVS
ncbi:MAG TPA: TIGR01777 family oxidoreductase [Bryobacteraceae bacterium]|nr:TIGR01777 family oxidoreductase [Bryobacteraceae bacterium]